MKSRSWAVRGLVSLAGVGVSLFALLQVLPAATGAPAQGQANGRVPTLD